MATFPVHFRVVGESEYMREVTIDHAGEFVVNTGDHTSHEPRHGTLDGRRRERLLDLLGALGTPRDHPAPDGATGFMAELTLGEGAKAQVFRFWEGAMEDEPALKAVVSELEMI